MIQIIMAVFVYIIVIIIINIFIGGNPIHCAGLPWWLGGKECGAMQETWVQSLSWGDPLEKEMAIHSGFLAWRIPWTEEPGGLQSGVAKSQT